MKQFFTYLLFIFFLGNSIAQTFDIPEKPNFQTSVYDYAKLLSPNQKSSLERKLIKYSDTTSTQIVLVITPTTNGEDIKVLAPRWGHEWGIGDAKKDNGVFILLAKNDRKISIAPGYGVEHKLTAGVTGQVIRNVIIPEFKKGDYYSGLDKGTDVIFQILNGTYKGTRQSENGFPFQILIFIIMVLLFVFIISRGNKGNGQGGRGYRDNSRGLFETIILTNSGRSSSSGGFGGFGGSGGFGSGGFGGGFGGGGFSGGGAGGSW